MRYFNISTGLRGCYMPDSSYVIAVSTRRELKSVLEAEARNYADADYIGGSKRAIAHIAALAWRDKRKGHLPYCLPFAPPHARDNYAFGVFVSNESRADYLEYVKESESC